MNTTTGQITGCGTNEASTTAYKQQAPTTGVSGFFAALKPSVTTFFENLGFRSPRDAAVALCAPA